MFMPDAPQNLSEYLHKRLTVLHTNATLVFVFDTSTRLAFGDSISTGGRKWHVTHYDGNDLAFRSTWLQLDTRATTRLVWVTPRPTPEPPDRPIDVSSLSDLIAKADDLIDMSMSGVINGLIPNQVWPAKVLEEYANLIGANLPAFVDGHTRLRTILGPRAALDAAAIRMLALHCSQPSVPVDDLLFQRDDAAQLLRHYMRLAWRTDWDAASRELLRQHVKASASIPLGDVEPWLDTPINELARYLYIRHFLSRNRVPQIANQIRGIGVLSFDPDRFETWVDQVLTRWEREPEWRWQILTSAENSLTAGDLARVAQLVTQPADDSGPYSSRGRPWHVCAACSSHPGAPTSSGTGPTCCISGMVSSLSSTSEHLAYYTAYGSSHRHCRLSGRSWPSDLNTGAGFSPWR